MITSISIRKNLFFAALAFICCSNALQAQDIITLKDGYEIQAKVLEIEDQIIKYKEFDNQDGPTHDIQKSDVFSIKYEDGTKYVFSMGNTKDVHHVSSAPNLIYNHGVRQNGTKVRPEQVRQTMSRNSKALDKYCSGRSFFVLGGVIGYPCAVLLGWDLGSRIFGKGNAVCFGIGLAGTVIGSVMMSIGESQMRKSVSLYNSSLMHGTAAYNLNFGITNSGGVGFTLNF